MAGVGEIQMPDLQVGGSAKKGPDNSGSFQPVVATPQISLGGGNNSTIVIEGPEEMAALVRIFRVLNFGKPGTAKTHFGLDMPAPIIAIDTENRIHIISKKFKHCNECDNDWFAKTFACPKCGSKDIRFKDIRRINVQNIEELDIAIDQAIIILQDVKNRTGKIGTIMIDSWTEGWNMVHEEHYDKYYAGLTPSEVKLSPRDDYKHINPRHNRIRKKLIMCGFNVYLTATEGDVYGKGDHQFDIIGVKPEGQKHNPHAVDWWMHSFLYNDKIAVMFEKNSIAKKDETIVYDFDYEQMCKTADDLELKEKMLTTELLKQIEEDLKAAAGIEDTTDDAEKGTADEVTEVEDNEV